MMRNPPQGLLRRDRVGRERRELPLDALGVGVALLGLVQVQRLSPDGAGFVTPAESGMRVTEVVEGIGGRVGVVERAEHAEGLLVETNGTVVVAGVVLDVAQTVEGGRFGMGVVVMPVQSQGRLAVAVEKYRLFHRAVTDMSEDLNDWLARALPPEEVDELKQVTVEVAGQRSLDLAKLLQAWKGHVDKIESD